MKGICYFQFGYHHPHSRESAQRDKDFDFESTGVFPIQADKSENAIKWGKCLAKWYLIKLYLEYPGIEYEWSPDCYACWIESEVPKGFEEIVRRIGIIQDNTYPEYVQIKKAFEV